MFLSTIAWGANLFITIVVILIAVGAGLTMTDFLKQKEKEEKLEESDQAKVDESTIQSLDE